MKIKVPPASTLAFIRAHMKLKGGRLFWTKKPNKFSKVKPGQEVGYIGQAGYRVVALHGGGLGTPRH
jgi:hypothetical protein